VVGKHSDQITRIHGAGSVTSRPGARRLRR
jgi:hypothetical protein